MHAHAGQAFFESQKPFGWFLIRLERSEDDPVQIPDPGVPGADGQRTGLQPDHQERGYTSKIAPD